jgi:lipopolysaccharide/colanic/teichoic acid biosynthesis glycosyltransferase
MIKRLADVVVSIFALLATGPMLIMIAAAIKATSRGPVLYRQARVGRYGVEFRIHKFRTMTVQSDALGPAITTADDPRITRLGKILRKYKLDELPQLIDVFLGRMSLVGPRPEVPRYVAMYSAEQRKVVLSVRPGMTDPASLLFRNESQKLDNPADAERKYIDEIMPRKLELSMRYVRDRSLGGDFSVILRTVMVLAGARIRDE